MLGYQRRPFEGAGYRTNHSHSGSKASRIRMERAVLASAWAGRTNHRCNHHMCSHGRDMDQQRSQLQMSPLKQRALLKCWKDTLQTQLKQPLG